MTTCINLRELCSTTVIRKACARFPGFVLRAVTPLIGYVGYFGCVPGGLFCFGQGYQKTHFLGLRRRSVFMFRAGFEKTWFGLNFFNLRKSLFGRLLGLPRGRRPGRGPGRPAGKISKNWGGAPGSRNLRFLLKMQYKYNRFVNFSVPRPPPKFWFVGPPGPSGVAPPARRNDRPGPSQK